LTQTAVFDNHAKACRLGALPEEPSVNSPFHADMQNVLVRMVVPMRREFGCALDVQQMRSDRVYAESIVAQALTSQVQSLRDSARLVDHHLSAARAPEQARRSRAERATPPADAVHHDAALAARRLIDLVGPMAEALAIRIERASDAQALEKLIGDARAFIAGVRGEASASDYVRQTARSGARKPEAAASARSSSSTVALRRSARFAAQELVALIGPLGRDLAERIEGASDVQTLVALIDEAHEGITAVIGAAAANEFVHRVT
jgi:hypothetical protein